MVGSIPVTTFGCIDELNIYDRSYDEYPNSRGDEMKLIIAHDPGEFMISDAHEILGDECSMLFRCSELVSRVIFFRKERGGVF